MAKYGGVFIGGAKHGGYGYGVAWMVMESGAHKNMWWGKGVYVEAPQPYTCELRLSPPIG